MDTTQQSPGTPQRSHNQALGGRGEELAAQYLLDQGFHLIAKNWRCRYGEIDLIMRDGSTFVAVEVKTRSGLGYGSPFEAITAQKTARLRRLILEWARVHKIRGAALRVDAVAIILSTDSTAPRLDHLRNIS